MAQDIRRILETSRVIAVLGASDKPARAGHYVPAYLLRHGYRVLPVNPVLAGQSLFGVDVVARLDGLSEPVDLVDVFRHPAHLPGHLDEILAKIAEVMRGADVAYVIRQVRKLIPAHCGYPARRTRAFFMGWRHGLVDVATVCLPLECLINNP